MLFSCRVLLCHQFSIFRRSAAGSFCPERNSKNLSNLQIAFSHMHKHTFTAHDGWFTHKNESTRRTMYVQQGNITQRPMTYQLRRYGPRNAQKGARMESVRQGTLFWGLRDGGAPQESSSLSQQQLVRSLAARQHTSTYARPQQMPSLPKRTSSAGEDTAPPTHRRRVMEVNGNKDNNKPAAGSKVRLPALFPCSLCMESSLPVVSALSPHAKRRKASVA